MTSIALNHCPRRTIATVGTLLIAAAHLVLSGKVLAGVVTLVTHGFRSGAGDWVAGMSDAAREYPRRTYEYGTTAPVYWLSFDSEGYLHAQKLSGPNFSNNPSGDILLLLDWNPYSGDGSDLIGLGDATSTKLVGPVVANNLVAADFIPGLGVPITRFPIHLIGHSRGGSLVCEIAKRLGERNIVVDHLTLLDPHPVNNDGFDDPIDPIDGTAKQGVYENVLFADAYYQTRGNNLTVPNGTFVSGSFIRWLDQSGITAGGYDNPHSNVHLWYHGTLAVLFPFTTDGTESINAATRSAWYAPVEEQGEHAGYLYSLRGGGNRREVFAAVNQFSGVPRHGLNGFWSTALAIPAANNRSAVTHTTEQRANVLEFNLRGLPNGAVSSFSLGAPLQILATNVGSGLLQAKLSYTFNGAGTCVLKVFADTDENTLNGWAKETQFSLTATGNTPRSLEFGLQSLADGLAAGFCRIGALISSPAGFREYYAPERLFLYPALSLAWTPVQVGNDQGFNFIIRGSRNASYILESSDDLLDWSQVFTSRLSDPGGNEVAGIDAWNSVSRPGQPTQFFRARYLD
jgi:pimeloyl-ACP methyl ester carboxylesterase